MYGTDHNFAFDEVELVLSGGKFSVGGLQSLPLGLHVAVDLVELDDVDDPSTQT